MLYSALTNVELQRWVRSSPKDHLAKAELLVRATRILDLSDDYITELEAQVEMLEEQNKEYDAIMRGYEEV